MPDRVRVGLIGSGFITSIHQEALRRAAGAEIVAMASPTPGRAERFAAERGIPRHFTDCRALLDLREVELVVLGLRNDLYCEATCLAAEAATTWTRFRRSRSPRGTPAGSGVE
jgi:predicted dehydrogenase